MNVGSERRLGIYIAIIVLAALLSFAYSVRTTGLFACQAVDKDSSQYLGICNVTNYGDYDHGAFWFELEPDAVAAAINADVLFVGNSRMQFGLSTAIMDEWFGTNRLDYFLMGFSHDENHIFLGPLIEKIRPKAELYVINIDNFFDDEITGPADSVMNHPESLNRYKQKRYWQVIHKRICGTVPLLCGNGSTYIRKQKTGAWIFKGADFLARMDFSDQPVPYNESIDKKMLSHYEFQARRFIASAPLASKCIVLTNVPGSNITAGTAKALAERLELPFIAPELEGLTTFDGSHLDLASALRWSTAFVPQLARQVQLCLNEDS